MHSLLNHTATTQIYTLSLHDALPIFIEIGAQGQQHEQGATGLGDGLNEKIDEVLALLFGKRLREEFLELIHVEEDTLPLDRKSTRLNSSHANISYAVFCLKKKTI